MLTIVSATAPPSPLTVPSLPHHDASLPLERIKLRGAGEGESHLSLKASWPLHSSHCDLVLISESLFSPIQSAAMQIYPLGTSTEKLLSLPGCLDTLFKPLCFKAEFKSNRTEMALAAAATDAAAGGICIAHKMRCNNVTGHLWKTQPLGNKASGNQGCTWRHLQQCLLLGGAPRPPLTTSFRPHQCFSLFKDTH